MNYYILFGLLLGINLIPAINFRLYSLISFVLFAIFYLTWIHKCFFEQIKLIILINEIVAGLIIPFNIMSIYLCTTYLYYQLQNIEFKYTIYDRK